LLVTKIDRLARSTSDLYRIISELAEKGVSFKVLDDLSIDTVPHRESSWASSP
jgi:DNA invertase Pin-like site-specific DNA recombinase